MPPPLIPTFMVGRVGLPSSADWPLVRAVVAKCFCNFHYIVGRYSETFSSYKPGCFVCSDRIIWKRCIILNRNSGGTTVKQFINQSMNQSFYMKHEIVRGGGV